MSNNVNSDTDSSEVVDVEEEDKEVSDEEEDDEADDGAVKETNNNSSYVYPKRQVLYLKSPYWSKRYGAMMLFMVSSTPKQNP